MSPKIKMTKHSINILAVTFFIATCLLMTKYNSRKPFLNTAFEEEDEKSEKYHESKVKNLFSAATSGKEFSGDPIRTFPNHQRKFTDKNFKLNKKLKNPVRMRNCTKWAVVTTIFSPPQESVRRFLYRLDWCIVIVGDKSKPQV